LTSGTLDRFVGQELGVSQWVRIDQSASTNSPTAPATASGSTSIADARARESPFGGTIAHGYLTLSTVGPAQLDVWIAPAGIGTALHYGLDKVRFLAPVPAGRRAHAGQARRGRIQGGGRTLVTTENTVEIEGQDKPALIAIALSMVVA
jgi:acyl dehydratase